MEMSQQQNKKGWIVIISGPSGVGKSTICREVVERMKNVHLSVSLTTRPPSKGEVDGKDYRFVSRDKFEELVRRDEILEHAEVFGNLYGTPRDRVEEVLQAGETIILEIDVQGARQAKSEYPEAVMIFILPPTHRVLGERISKRGREGAEAAEERLEGAEVEIAGGWQYFENMVINDDLEQAVGEVMQIIRQNTGEQYDRGA